MEDTFSKPIQVTELLADFGGLRHSDRKHASNRNREFAIMGAWLPHHRRLQPRHLRTDRYRARFRRRRRGSSVASAARRSWTSAGADSTPLSVSASSGISGSVDEASR